MLIKNQKKLFAYTEPKRILVLAGNFEQAQNYIRDNREDGNEYYYANGSQAIYGRRYDKFEVVGTFWQKEDAGELYRFAKTNLR